MKTNKFDKPDTYYSDYPSEPCGGTNPNWKCCFCGATHPQINGKLAGHWDGCEWVEKKMRQLGGGGIDTKIKYAINHDTRKGGGIGVLNLTLTLVNLS